MNVLLNGCSFMDNWHYKGHFAKLLNADVVNLAKAGSSNRRIIRTSIDHIESNAVDVLILGLTFYDRQESPFAVHGDPWVSYNSQGIQAVFSDITNYSSPTEYDLIGRYVIDRYRYDINQHYLDQLYIDLRMLSGYLKHKQIKFCIFNTCDRHHKNIDLGPGFLPFDFIGNEYLYENNCVSYEQDAGLSPNAQHHYEQDVIILAKYLKDHIR
jgi:hypothetical protein